MNKENGMALPRGRKKKAPRARRITKGATGAPTDDYRRAVDFFHFDVDKKEYTPIIKAYVKRKFDKETAKAILKNPDSSMAYSNVACFCHYNNNGYEGIPDTTVAWMEKFFNEKAEVGKDIVQVEEAKVEVIKNTYVPSIQERIKEASGNVIASLEEVVDQFIDDPAKFKKPDIAKLFRSLKVNQAHCRHIRSFYEGQLAEYNELTLPAREQDEQLKEAYAHLSKADVKKAVDLFQSIVSACDMITAESKATRKTRKPRAKSADKLIAKLKYKVSDDKFKVASINPIDIIGASELWVFNTKTRKIGKYVAESIDPTGQGREGSGLSVKGTTLQGFKESESIAKTLRKPEEQLAEFNSAGKVKLRKYLDEIKAVDTKMNGRINADTILLKAVK